MHPLKPDSALRQDSLFDPVPHRPRWEELPPEVCQRIIQLMGELFASPPAQSLLTSWPEGGRDE
jgi:hypothetical protein